jgi:hypothetical protein
VFYILPDFQGKHFVNRQDAKTAKVIEPPRQQGAKKKSKNIV